MASPIPTAETSDAEPICLAFANTVSYRKGDRRNDRLADSEAVMSWLEGAGLVQQTVAHGFDANRHFERAIRLRESIYNLASAIAAGKDASSDDLFVLNGELRDALLLARIAGHPDGLRWDLERLRTPNGALGVLALSAANLLSGPMAGRLRECADERCGWLFLDQSKNRSRKWCSMSDCGNLAKARRHYAKVRKAV